MFQVLALVAMDPPLSFDAEAIRNEKVKVLQSIQPIRPHDVVRGQYTTGTVGGEAAAAYRDEPGVSPKSTTETYAALRLHLESWRWSGVPFLLRTGKRLPTRDTRVVITFQDVPLHLFKTAGVHTLHRNRLVVRIQPDEGIALSFVAKQPGPEVTAQSVDMNFNYGDSFKTSPPEAYERLLHDALEGDHTLFIREDEVEFGWKAVEPVIEAPPPITFYPPARGDPMMRHASRARATGTIRSPRYDGHAHRCRPRRHEHSCGGGDRRGHARRTGTPGHAVTRRPGCGARRGRRVRSAGRGWRCDRAVSPWHPGPGRSARRASCTTHQT